MGRNKMFIFRDSCGVETYIWYQKPFPVHIWSWYQAILQQLLVETLDVLVHFHYPLLCSAVRELEGMQVASF